MKSLNEIYKGRFFARRDKLAWRVPFVCRAINGVLHPRSLIDLGCATGDFVNGFLDMGVDAYGLEGTTNCLDYIQIPRERMLIWDLRKKLPHQEAIDKGIPFGLRTGFGVALCLEVAEHIEEEHCDVFLDNLATLSKKIVMSYAPPGQGGHYHVNCQDAEYWVDKMYVRGFLVNNIVRDKIKKFWIAVAHKREMRSYYNHLLYFEVIR